jgi:FkbM family methyltransferase
MRRRIESLLVSLSSNNRSQRLLERGVIFAQYLMGIGSGSCPESSGEHVLVEKLQQKYATGRQPLCIFDVGANKGQFLTMIVQGLQSKSIPFSVHAFEPSRSTYEVLHDNFKDRSNVSLNNFGLGEQSGELELFYDEVGSGLASLSKRRLDHLGIYFKYSEKVAIKILDEYCSEQGVGSIDLLKLDVEGHELDVLRGGLRMFRERRIRMVSFEFGGCNIDTRTFIQDFWYFLQENGMGRVYRIAPSGHLVRLPRYSEALEQFGTSNFLALQSEA